MSSLREFRSGIVDPSLRRESEDRGRAAQKAQPRWRKQPMAHSDIANVRLISDDELASAMGLLLDCVGLQTRANDIAGRWATTDLLPEDFDLGPMDDEHEVVPFKSADAAKAKFRSA